MVVERGELTARNPTQHITSVPYPLMLALVKTKRSQVKRQSDSMPGPGNHGPEYPGDHNPEYPGGHDPGFQSLLPMEEPL